jgi:hypothetical protein
MNNVNNENAPNKITGNIGIPLLTSTFPSTLGKLPALAKAYEYLIKSPAPINESARRRYYTV